MVTEYPHLDKQVNDAISKIDSYVKNPKSPPPLDAELKALLVTLQDQTSKISQTRNSQEEMRYHQRRINRLQYSINRYEAAKKNIKNTTRAGLDNVTTQSDQGDTESSEESAPLIDIKKSLENESKTPMTVASLTQSLQPLEKEKDPLARTIILNTAWSRLSQQGYNMTIQCGTIGLENPDNKGNASQLQGALNSHLNNNIFTLNEIQSTIMTGTRGFGEYVKLKSDNIDSASFDGYVQHLTQKLKMSFGPDKEINISLVRNHTSATQAEKAFLISYLTDGYTSYDAVPDVKRRIELQQKSIELRTSETYSKAKQIVDRASGGEYGQEQRRRQEGGQGELTFESFMDNPAMAIAEYPWTSLALIAGSIYQFGFMKTIGGLFAGAVGIKAINELAEKTPWGRKLKENLGKGFNKAVDTAGEALDRAGNMAGDAYESGTAALASGTAALASGTAVGADTIPKGEETMKNKIEPLPARTPSQEKGYQAMKLAESQINASITGAKKRNSKLTGTFDQYEEFIRSIDFQTQKLSSLIFTGDPKDSIFTPSSSFGDLKIAVPSSLDNATFKLVLRAYMGIGLDASGTPNTEDWGKVEKDAFIQKSKIDDTWKDKTVSELTTKLYS